MVSHMQRKEGGRFWKEKLELVDIKTYYNVTIAKIEWFEKTNKTTDEMQIPQTGLRFIYVFNICWRQQLKSLGKWSQ